MDLNTISRGRNFLKRFFKKPKKSFRKLFFSKICFSKILSVSKIIKKCWLLFLIIESNWYYNLPPIVNNYKAGQNVCNCCQRLTNGQHRTVITEAETDEISPTTEQSLCLGTELTSLTTYALGDSSIRN